jgi:sulfur carrier protein ThiS
MVVQDHPRTLTTRQEIHEGATLRELFLQLADGRYQPLVSLTYDFEAEALTHQVLVILNDEAIGAKSPADIILKHRDRIGFLTFFAGG